MLDESFDRVYTKFKLHFYRSIFSRFQDREASLTTVETFCVEIINALGHPTVNEFSSFVNISPPNAAYKVRDPEVFRLLQHQPALSHHGPGPGEGALSPGGCGQTGGDAGRDLRRAHARAGPQYPAPVPPRLMNQQPVRLCAVGLFSFLCMGILMPALFKPSPWGPTPLIKGRCREATEGIGKVAGRKARRMRRHFKERASLEKSRRAGACPRRPCFFSVNPPWFGFFAGAAPCGRPLGRLLLR